MRATRDLPEGYHHLNTLNLSSIRTALWLNLGAFVLLILFSWLFGKLVVFIRAANPLPGGLFELFGSLSAWSLPALIFAIAVMIVLHELIHAAFFVIFTRDKPRFALTTGYAFAAAPEWYIPCDQYILVGLSPFMLISLVFLLLVGIVNIIYIPYLFLVLVFNAAGSLGDFLVIGWVLRQPTYSLINDRGDKFSSYGKD